MADIATIGRDRELAEAAAFLDRIRAGPAALLVEGPPGIGKTTVMRAIAAAAHARDYRTLIARPVEAEAKVSHAGLAELFGPVLDAIAGALPSPQYGALSAATVHTNVETVNAATVGAGVRSALEALGVFQPVVLLIDDVRWLDGPTADALTYALRRVRDAQVGVVLSIRTPAPSALPLRLDQALPATAVTRVSLATMTVGAIHHVLAEVLDEPPTRGMLTRIHEASGGNPMLAIELASAVARSPQSVRPTDPLPIGGLLSDIITERVRALSGAARRLVLVVSADARPTVDSILAVTGEASWEESGGPEAEAAGVIDLRDGAVTFTHPLLRSAAYALASAPERRGVHQRLAVHTTDPEVRARHLGSGAAGPDDVVAAALDEGAMAAWRRGAPATATELCDMALRLTPAAAIADSHRRLTELVTYCLEAGDNERAEGLLREALAADLSGVVLAVSLQRLARVRSDVGEFGAASRLLTEAQQHCADDVAVSARVLHDLAWVAISAGDPVTAIDHANAGLAAVEAASLDDLVPALATVLLFAEFLAGGGARADLLAMTEGIADDSDSPLDPMSVSALGTVLFEVEEFERGREYLLMGRRNARAHGSDHDLSLALAGSADLEWRVGDFAAAASFADEAIEVATLIDDRWLRGTGLAMRARVDTCLGAVDDARAGAEEALRLGYELNMPGLVGAATAVLGFLEASVGDAAATHARLGPMAMLAIGAMIADPGLLAWSQDEGEALVVLGDLAAAERLVAWYDERCRAVARPSGIGRARRVRSLITAARGDLDRAMSEADEAVAIHAKLPLPIDLGRSLLAQGQIRRRSKQRRAARDSFEAARTTFARLGMPLWLRRADAELARVVPRTARASEGTLTNTERRCAELAAQGSRNRQIAAELFISERTVVTNLTRAYAKLGVTARAQLASALEDGRS